jgi:phospholipid/cholesterol/gamma-HCH transport system substrate-binding protein
VAETARSLRDLGPSVDRTLDEFRNLARDARSLVPVLRANLEDAGAAARNIARLSERADVILQTNQDRIEQSLESLNKTMAGAAKMFSDKNIDNASRTLENVNKASENLPSISRNADDLMKQGTTTMRRLMDTMTRAEAVMTDLQRITRPLGDRSDRISRNIDESLVQVNQILGDMRALMRAIDRADGTFRKFLTDPTLYNNVDAATCMVLKMMPRLDRILKDFETFADKLARHPEKIGLGGAVRPSDGLKNPPTPPLPPAGPFPGPGPNH